MSKPDSRLLFIVMTLIALAVVWSCSQPDDVTAPSSLTHLWLTAERLPDPPPGMLYELWVAADPVTDTILSSEDVISLGRFSYVRNDTIDAFLDTGGVLRADSNRFVLDDDLFSYSTILISRHCTIPSLVLINCFRIPHPL